MNPNAVPTATDIVESVPSQDRNGHVTAIPLHEACDLLRALCPSLEIGRGFTVSMLPRSPDHHSCAQELAALSKSTVPRDGHLFESRRVDLSAKIDAILRGMTNGAITLLHATVPVASSSQ